MRQSRYISSEKCKRHQLKIPQQLLYSRLNSRVPSSSRQSSKAWILWVISYVIWSILLKSRSELSNGHEPCSQTLNLKSYIYVATKTAFLSCLGLSSHFRVQALSSTGLSESHVMSFEEGLNKVTLSDKIALWHCGVKEGKGIVLYMDLDQGWCDQKKPNKPQNSPGPTGGAGVGRNTSRLMAIWCWWESKPKYQPRVGQTNQKGPKY